MIQEVRCPICGRFLGRFEGRGETKCPRCRGNKLIIFDTSKDDVHIKEEPKE